MRLGIIWTCQMFYQTFCVVSDRRGVSVPLFVRRQLPLLRHAVWGQGHQGGQGTDRTREDPQLTSLIRQGQPTLRQNHTR